jgi:PAP2 superfamily
VIVFRALCSGALFWCICCVPVLLCWAVGGRRWALGRAVVRLWPVGAFYGVYIWLVAWTQKASVLSLARANGEGIVAVERALHIWVEPWVSHHDLPGAGAYYDWAQLVVVFGLLAWLTLAEGDSFWRVARNSLALISAGGFLVYWLLPVAPPWTLPASYGIHSAGLANLQGVGDLLGAMPSLHTAWAGWVAMVVWVIVPGRLRWLGWVNLVVTAVVVVMTGNHYVLDVVAGELLAWSSCEAASLVEVRRVARLMRFGELVAA